MGKYLLGVLTVVIIIAVMYGGIILFDWLGVVSREDLLFATFESLTGLEDLQENYELGQKRSQLFKKRENELKAEAKRLAERAAQLEGDRAELENQKQQWLQNHPRPASSQTEQPSATADPGLKNYLATIGTMKPEKAAAVIQKLPDETVFLIFDQLRANQVSKLMEKLPSEYLIRLTENRLKQRR
ncbi:MAG TPA: hypothetical protein VIM29_00750 [Bacillota bacterium]